MMEESFQRLSTDRFGDLRHSRHHRLEHLEDNQAAGRGRLPDAALRKRMEEWWESTMG